MRMHQVTKCIEQTGSPFEAVGQKPTVVLNVCKRWISMRYMVPFWVEGGCFATYEAEEERRQSVEAKKLVTNTSRCFTRCTQDMIPHDRL